MLNPEESIAELQKYFKKLSRIINEESSYGLFGGRSVNKARVDDIICCIEGSFPEEYKRYIDRYGLASRVKSYRYFQQLQSAIKNKNFWNGNSYSVNMNDANQLIKSIQAVLPGDIRFIYSSESGMV